MSLTTICALCEICRRYSSLVLHYFQQCELVCWRSSPPDMLRRLPIGGHDQIFVTGVFFMRHLPLIAAVCTASALLAACSSATASVPTAVISSSGTDKPCTSTLQAWLHGPGGGDLQSALIAGTAMGAALESGSRTRVAGAAQELNSAASRADNHLPPACADHGSAYQIAMHDWMTGASDARVGNLNETSSKIATGAHVIDAVTMLQRLSPALLKDLSRPVAIPAAPAASAAPAPAATTAAPSTEPAVAPSTAPAVAPSTAPAAAPTQAATTPAGCYPISDEGTCYEPGEYCRDDDHGTSGVAGDGKAITCEDNDGWRWEPA
jgi:hypothetical protein